MDEMEIPLALTNAFYVTPTWGHIITSSILLNS